MAKVQSRICSFEKNVDVWSCNRLFLLCAINHSLKPKPNRTKTLLRVLRSKNRWGIWKLSKIEYKIKIHKNILLRCYGMDSTYNYR